jgi:hypothetical protein
LLTGAWIAPDPSNIPRKQVPSLPFRSNGISYTASGKGATSQSGAIVEVTMRQFGSPASEDPAAETSDEIRYHPRLEASLCDRRS